MERNKHTESIPGMFLMLAAVIILALAYSCEPAHAQSIGEVQIDVKAGNVLEKSIKSQKIYELRRTYSRPEKAAPHRETIMIYQSSELKDYPQLRKDLTTGEIKKLDKVKKAKAIKIISRIWQAISNYGMAFGDEVGDTAYENIIAQDDYEVIWTYTDGRQSSKDIQSATLFDGLTDCRVQSVKTYDASGNSQGFGEWIAYADLI